MVRFPLLFAFPPRASPDIPSPLRVRNIGVSHSAIHNLETPLTHPSLKTVPRANQIELHPSNPSPKLVAYCRTHSIHCTGYSCLGSTNSPLYKDATLLQLAEKKGKTPQQCLLMWGLQKGWSVIPKSVNAERVEENCELDGWGLDKGEMEALDGLEGRFEVCADGWLPAKVFLGDDE